MLDAFSFSLFRLDTYILQLLSDIRANFCFIFHDFIGTTYFSGNFSFSFVYGLGFGISIYISRMGGMGG